MNFPGHIKGALFTGIMVSAFLIPQKSALPCGLIAFIGHLSPDLDTHSTPRKWAVRFAWFLIPILAVLEFHFKIENAGYIAIAYIAVLVATGLSKHRGWTHWSIFPYILIAAGIYLQNYYLLSSGIGWLSHLMLDINSIRSVKRMAIGLNP